MSAQSWYRVDTKRLAHETIDGEVIIIHLVRGSYFSLDGIGTGLWDLLVQGRGRDETLDLLGQRYDAEPDLIAKTVDELVATLAEEELVEFCSLDGTAGPYEGPPAAEKQPFKAPQLQKYTDMQHFLLVDPLHDVDETGWPSAQPAA